MNKQDCQAAAQREERLLNHVMAAARSRCRAIRYDDAEDCVMDCCLWALLRCRSEPPGVTVAEDEGRLAADVDVFVQRWLERRRCRERTRRRSGLDPDLLNDANIDSEHLAACRSNDPYECVAQAEVVELVREAVTCLPDAQRRALTAVLISDISVKEYCRINNCSRESVWKSIQRGRESLRASLKAAFHMRSTPAKGGARRA